MTEETPIHKRAVVFTIPGMDDVLVQRDIAYASVGGHASLAASYRPSIGVYSGKYLNEET